MSFFVVPLWIYTYLQKKKKKVQSCTLGEPYYRVVPHHKDSPVEPLLERLRTPNYIILLKKKKKKLVLCGFFE